MLEKNVERKLIETVKKMGGECVKWVSPASRGWPDRIVLLPGGKVVFVEVKTDTGKLSELQKSRMALLEKLGMTSLTIYGIKDIEKITQLPD